MHEIDDEPYNNELILLKEKHQVTAIKLSELTNININTIKSWLVNSSSTKWRKLSRSIFYLIKSKLVFMDDKNSFDQRSNIQFLSNLVDTALLLARNSILTKQPLTEEDLSYINQALEINGILCWHLDEILPADKEETEILENLKNDDSYFSELTKHEEHELVTMKSN